MGESLDSVSASAPPWTLPLSHWAVLYNEPLSDGSEKGGREEMRGVEFQLLSKVWSFLENSASKLPQTGLRQTTGQPGCDR